MKLSLPWRRRRRRQRRNPFREGVTHRLIVHGSHHKVGTTWMSKVLRGLAEPLGLELYSGPQDGLPGSADIFIENHSRFDLDRLPPFRGSHLIRDPRDVVISAYHYHLWTTEKWANIPMGRLPEVTKERWRLIEPERHAGLTYREYLNTLDPEEGLATEMKRSVYTFLREVTSWNYDDPRFIELRYEDLVQDERGWFARVFEHYGLNEEATRIGMEAVEAASFRNRTRREPGQVAERSHLRVGKAGQWKTEFTPAHVRLCKELFGEALIQLGYEKDLDW